MTDLKLKWIQVELFELETIEFNLKMISVGVLRTECMSPLLKFLFKCITNVSVKTTSAQLFEVALAHAPLDVSISTKFMPIVADNFTIPVSLILLWYTVVRTVVYSSVPRYTAVRFLQAVPNPSIFVKKKTGKTKNLQVLQKVTSLTDTDGKANTPGRH